MKGALPDFGAIIVTVDTKDGVPVSARTRSTRGPMVSKLLEGRQADESIPSLISMLYTLCPVAQSTAWRAARAYAEGTPSAKELENWAAGVQLEAMIEHLRCLAFELPRSLDIESRSDAKLIGRLRTRVTGVSRLSKKELEALRKDVADCADELLYQTEDVPTLGSWRPTDQMDRLKEYSSPPGLLLSAQPSPRARPKQRSGAQHRKHRREEGSCGSSDAGRFLHGTVPHAWISSDFGSWPPL